MIYEIRTAWWHAPYHRTFWAIARIVAIAIYPFTTEEQMDAFGLWCADQNFKAYAVATRLAPPWGAYRG